MNLADIYASKHYKKLLIIPIVILILSLFFATQLKYGIEFSGGSLITGPIDNDIDALELKNTLLTKHDLLDIDVRQTGSELARGIYIQYSGESNILDAQTALEEGNYDETIAISKTFIGEINATGNQSELASAYFSKAREIFKNNLLSDISEFTGTPIPDFSIREIGPSLGTLFWEQGKNAIIMAFSFIIILVFLFFRKPLISLAVVQASFFDVLVGIGFIGLIGEPISLVTIAPLLMLIGYSVDSNIMLTDRVMKRKVGTIYERAEGAFKTGITMTGTTIGSLTSLYIVSTLVGIDVLSTIALILLVGLFADLISTWITNVTLILWNADRIIKKKGRL